MTAATKLIGALFAATILTAPAFAQSYPERQITMVVPFSAGGPTDTVARLVAERMSADLGQQIVIQNVGGAGGTCVLRGCVPKKLIVYASSFTQEFAESRGFGWGPLQPPQPCQLQLPSAAAARRSRPGKMSGTWEQKPCHTPVMVYPV